MSLNLKQFGLKCSKRVFFLILCRKHKYSLKIQWIECCWGLTPYKHQISVWIEPVPSCGREEKSFLKKSYQNLLERHRTRTSPNKPEQARTRPNKARTTENVENMKKHSKRTLARTSPNKPEQVRTTPDKTGTNAKHIPWSEGFGKISQPPLLEDVDIKMQEINSTSMTTTCLKKI